MGYADADFVNDYASKKSTSGFNIFIDGNLVAFSSQRQRSVAKSTFEADL